MNAYAAPVTLEAMAARRILDEACAAGIELDGEGTELVVASETNFNEVLGGLVRRIAEEQALADGAEALARTYRDRASGRKSCVERLRGIALGALETVGLRTVRLPEATVSIGHGQPGVVVTDEQLVPIRYRKADPRVEAAYEQLLRAAAYAASNGHDAMAADFRGTAMALLAHFMLDRKAIAQALKAGQEVAGAALSNGSSWLVVRS